ncbi:hypothetical protein BJ322DRAFT_332572 [Thelephora terrestris]|uniref:C3H1-type domain-containing protein n=1 Tax=Thelephora terrestris TaxID=56493 RepID=A0A9P6H7V2_9AGAM|nr:hypothetical protein BJ322DRAFT_332572 [Thelephora terrestris]
MATSAMKIQPGTLSLHTYNTYRDMMTIQAPSKKPICQRYQRGECSGKCPYFHPASLPPQSAPLKTTPTTSKQPKSTPNPTKLPTQPTPSTSTPTSPQPPKKEEKSVSIPVVPGRQGQKVSSTSSRPAKPQTSQVPVPPTHPSRQSRSSTLVSGSQTEAQMFNSDDSRVKGSKGTPSSVSPRPQNVVSSSVAISAVTPRSVEPTPMQETPSSPSTSGTSPSRKNGGRGKKKPEKSENSTTEVHLSRESVPPEQLSIPESSLAQRDQTQSHQDGKSVGNICINYPVRRIRVHTITIPNWPVFHPCARSCMMDLATGDSAKITTRRITATEGFAR